MRERIVALGGNVCLESSPNGGSRLSVTLRAGASDAPDAP
jgi:signal transduction histidine kinase